MISPHTIGTPLPFNELRYNKTPAQVLIRWSLQKGFVCIPKTVKEERMIENADVFDFSISQQDMEEMVSDEILNITPSDKTLTHIHVLSVYT